MGGGLGGAPERRAGSAAPSMRHSHDGSCSHDGSHPQRLLGSLLTTSSTSSITSLSAAGCPLFPPPPRLPPAASPALPQYYPSLTSQLERPLTPHMPANAPPPWAPSPLAALPHARTPSSSSASRLPSRGPSRGPSRPPSRDGAHGGARSQHRLASSSSFSSSSRGSLLPRASSAASLLPRRSARGEIDGPRDGPRDGPAPALLAAAAHAAPAAAKSRQVELLLRSYGGTPRKPMPFRTEGRAKALQLLEAAAREHAQAAHDNLMDEKPSGRGAARPASRPPQDVNEECVAQPSANHHHPFPTRTRDTQGGDTSHTP